MILRASMENNKIREVDVPIMEVSSANVEEEMKNLCTMLNTHPAIALDTEFPGFLHKRPMSDPEDLRYNDMVFNVNNLKLIQLGLTLFNERGHIGGCWQVNISDFDMNEDRYVPESIQLLKTNGIDFEKVKRDGVDPRVFVEKFNDIIERHRDQITWVTFHGMYDLAYLSKLLTKEDIPSSKSEFVKMVVAAMGGMFYDVKVMSGQRQFLSLEILAKNLSVDRVGDAHQAGSDSLLTAKMFWRLLKEINEYVLEKLEGRLFGFSVKLDASAMSEDEACEMKIRSEMERHYAPVCMVPRQIYAPQRYYVAPQGCYPRRILIGPGYPFPPQPVFYSMHGHFPVPSYFTPMPI